MTALKIFLKKMECNKRMQIVFFCISMTVLFALFIPSILFFKEQNVMSQEIVSDYDILSNIEAKKNNNQIELSGWILRLNSQNKDVKIILKDTNGSEDVILRTEMSKKTKIGEYVATNWNFGNYDFYASVNEKKLIKDVCYEVLFLHTYEESLENKNCKKISSGKYLYNGEIYSHDPTTFIQPSFQDEFMNTVILEGKICFFDIETGCWVYHYEDTLYLIVNDKFGLTEDKERRMKFHIHTAQRELLPEDRQQYGFESKDFYFNEKEYILSENSEYRVAILNLPDSYETTYIELGLYETGGISITDISFPIYDWKIN